MLSNPLIRPRRPQQQSLRQEYAEFLEQRIEEYKEQLSREDLLAIADEAVRELEVASDEQLVLTEVLVLEHVDRLIMQRLALPSALRRHVVPKGSIAIDGISLTVGDTQRGSCRVYVIPETLERTRVGSYRPGDRVNLEVDLVAKYVESLLGRRNLRR